MGGQHPRRKPSSSTIQLEKVIKFSSSSIIVVFAGVVLYSIWQGGVDFVIPVKYGLLTVLFLLLYRPLDDIGLISVAKQTRTSPKTLGVNIYYFILAVIGASLLARYSIPFLLSSYSYVDLTMQTLDVKFFTTVGVLPSIVIAIYEIRNILKLAFRRWRP